MVKTGQETSRQPSADGVPSRTTIDQRMIAGFVGLAGLLSLAILAAASWFVSDGGLDYVDFLLFIFLLMPLLPGLLLAEALAFTAGRRIVRPRAEWRLYARIYATYILGPILVAYLLGVTIAALLDRRGAYFTVAEMFATHASLLWIPAVVFGVVGLLLLPLLKVMRRQRSRARLLPAAGA